MTRTNLRSCHHLASSSAGGRPRPRSGCVTCHETRVSPSYHHMRSSRIHQSRIQHDSVIHISTVLRIAFKCPVSVVLINIPQKLPSAATIYYCLLLALLWTMSMIFFPILRLYANKVRVPPLRLKIIDIYYLFKLTDRLWLDYAW